MKKELLFSITKKDFDIDYFSGTGAGGQHRNKHQNCVRLRHKESDTMSTGQSNRDRKSNMREAIKGILEDIKFKLWLNNKINEIIEGKTIDQKVDEMMNPVNIKVEMKDKNKWVELK